MSKPVAPCPTDTIEDVLCKIFCEVRKEGEDFKNNPKNAGKRFDYSRRAKELAESKYKNALKALGNFIPEKSFLVSVAKGSLGKTARKVYTEAALKRRLAKEAAEAAGEKLAKGAAKKVATKVVLKFIPIVNVLSTAYDIYEVGSAAYEIYQTVDEFMKKYDTFMIRPDMAEVGPDGEVKKVYDYKFDYPNGGKDAMGDEQEKLYRAKTGQDPVKIDQKKCGCK